MKKDVKKRKPQDATMRNVRANHRRWRTLARKLAKIEAKLSKIAYDVVTLHRCTAR